MGWPSPWSSDQSFLEEYLNGPGVRFGQFTHVKYIVVQHIAIFDIAHFPGWRSKYKTPWKMWSSLANVILPGECDPLWKMWSSLENVILPGKCYPPWKMWSSLENVILPGTCDPPWKKSWTFTLRKFSMHSRSFQDTELKLRRWVEDLTWRVDEGLTILGFYFPSWNKTLLQNYQINILRWLPVNIEQWTQVQSSLPFQSCPRY